MGGMGKNNAREDDCKKEIVRRMQRELYCRAYRLYATEGHLGSHFIAMFVVTSPIVINVPTRGLLAGETMHATVQWLENLNIKRNMTSMFVNKKHRYYNYHENLDVLKKWLREIVF